MTRKRKSIPAFESEGEERAFWESHDSTGHVNWSKAQRVRFPNLKPSTKPISLRLPVACLSGSRRPTKGRPLQSLIKVWLSEKIASTRTSLVNRRKVGGGKGCSDLKPRCRVGR